MQVDKAPYLFIWGYGKNQAWGLPQLFEKDKPVHFQAAGPNLYVLTEKNNFYRVNCETRDFENISQREKELSVASDNPMEGDSRPAATQPVLNFTCGSDFIMTLRG